MASSSSLVGKYCITALSNFPETYCDALIVGGIRNITIFLTRASSFISEFSPQIHCKGINYDVEITTMRTCLHNRVELSGKLEKLKMNQVSH